MRESETKNYVRERMDQLESREIPRRGAGRPRIHPEGYRPDRRKPGVDPEISAVRSAAGKKWQQTRQSILQTEASRKKFGRIKQEAFDAEVAALKEEMKQYTYAPGLDQQDTQEVFEWSVWMIEDCIWKRKWHADTLDAMDEDIERPKEEQQFCHGYPELRIGDLLSYAKHVLSPERTGLKNLVVRAFEEFIAWAPTQGHADDQFKQAIPQAEKAVQKLKGSIFKGHLLPEDDPRLDPPEPLRSVEEQIAFHAKQRKEWELQGRDVSAVRTRIETLHEEKLRIEREMEQAILEQKAEDARRALEQQQRALLGQQYDDIQKYLHGGDDIFGSTPQRR